MPPRVVEVSSEQDELTRVINEIRALAQAGIPLHQLMVIHAEWQGAERLRQRLAEAFGSALAINPRMRNAGQGIRVCTLDSSTGLESPIVFLVGTHRLREAEGSSRLSAEERSERIRDNTRRLYMAMTRAGQRLVITSVGTMPQELYQSASPS
jgi:superfamily I DNA/RNA helicase